MGDDERPTDPPRGCAPAASRCAFPVAGQAAFSIWDDIPGRRLGPEIVPSEVA